MNWLDWLSIFRPKIKEPFTAPKTPSAAKQVLRGKSGYSFSGRSLTCLASVDARLQAVAHRALQISMVDFGVVQCKRTPKEQEALVAKGASQTLDSQHLSGKAVDVAAYQNGRINWNGDLYLKVATAFVYAAEETGTGIRWGGAWHIPDIRACADKADPGKTMVALYKELRRRQKRGVFLDLGHFELADR